jgi:hypothetical protein
MVRQLKRAWDQKTGTLVNAKDDHGNLIYVESTERTLDDVWRFSMLQPADETENLRFPTQKPETLLDTIIESSSRPNDIVLDCFVGSGTTAAVAQKLGRRWIAADINKGAIQTTSKRVQKILLEQLGLLKVGGREVKAKKQSEPMPARYTFAVYRVNEYDLQLLKTEAEELAVQHVGITRARTDSFFDGTYGKNLAKIIDFNHPLTLLDFQLIQDELQKRPEETRNITIVCLGKELVVDPWVKDYNKKHPVNKFEIIELRTDDKYGRFLTYKPPEAKVRIERKGDKAKIQLTGFVSSSIIERLNDPAALVRVKVTDFRTMIDALLIDNHFDGKVFNIKYSDVPDSRSELIKGKYEIDISRQKTTIGVKVIDMLGEECVMTETI